MHLLRADIKTESQHLKVQSESLTLESLNLSFESLKDDARKMIVSAQSKVNL